MFAKNSSSIILLALSLLGASSFTSAKAGVLGGGDPSGCYASRANFETPYCQEVHISNLRRVSYHEDNGETCRKDERHWICKGDATIFIPHEGRLDK